MVESPVTNTLYAVSMVSSTDGCAVGANGVILRYQVELNQKVFCPMLMAD